LADVQSVLNGSSRFALDFRLAIDAERRREIEAGFSELNLPTGTNLLSREGEDHHRLRTLVSKAFTPRLIADLRPRIQAIADELLDAVSDRKTMDLVDSYAFPLPIIVIADLLDHLRAHPSEMPQAVEEFLRYDSPVERAIARWVTPQNLRAPAGRGSGGGVRWNP
jgi:cytochrome P450